MKPTQTQLLTGTVSGIFLFTALASAKTQQRTSPEDSASVKPAGAQEKPTPKTPVPPAAKPPPVIVPRQHVKGTVQLHPMYLDKKIFTPDKWWGYEEADDDRPEEFSVQQEGNVSLGGRYEANHGAQVKYVVRMFSDANQAHQFFDKSLNKTKTVKLATPLVFSRIQKGDEGFTVDNSRMNDGKKIAFARSTMIRYDKYLVTLNANSNMRALGPRPAHGERKWLAEAVYDTVLKAALVKWTAYKTLLVQKKSK